MLRRGVGNVRRVKGARNDEQRDQRRNADADSDNYFLFHTRRISGRKAEKEKRRLRFSLIIFSLEFRRSISSTKNAISLSPLLAFFPASSGRNRRDEFEPRFGSGHDEPNRNHNEHEQRADRENLVQPAMFRRR